MLLALASCVPPAAAPVDPTAPVAPTPTPAPPPAPAPVNADFTILRGTPVQGGMLLGRVPDTTRALTLDGRAIHFAPDGGFLIAFDRHAPAPQLLGAIPAHGRTGTPPTRGPPRPRPPRHPPPP